MCIGCLSYFELAVDPHIATFYSLASQSLYILVLLFSRNVFNDNGGKILVSNYLNVYVSII